MLSVIWHNILGRHSNLGDGWYRSSLSSNLVETPLMCMRKHIVRDMSTVRTSQQQWQSLSGNSEFCSGAHGFESGNSCHYLVLSRVQAVHIWCSFFQTSTYSANRIWAAAVGHPRGFSLWHPRNQLHVAVEFSVTRLRSFPYTICGAIAMQDTHRVARPSR